MKICIISGSHRNESQSRKVANWLKQKLEQKNSEAIVYDLNENPISLDINKVWEENSPENAAAKQWKEAMQEADGYIVVSPEWNGMASSAYKNAMHHVGQAMAHKPALLVAVSSGRGGAFVVADLRLSSYKNSKVCYLPEHVIVRDVNNVLNGQTPDESNSSDAFYHERFDFAMSLLISYARALSAVRADETIDFEKFENGMS